MSRRFNRSWRYIVATLFLGTIVIGCKSKALDPMAADRATIDYIVNDLKGDLLKFDSTIEEIEKVKLTRQDNIPIALVDIIYKDGSTSREFYYFNFEDIARVYNFMAQQQDATTEAMATSLSLSEQQVECIQRIIAKIE